MTALPGHRPRRGPLRRRLRWLWTGPALNPDRPGRWVGRAVVSAAGLTALAAIIGYLLLEVNGVRVPLLQLWLVFTAALLLQWLLHTVAVPPLTPPPMPDSEADLRARPFATADRWQQRLSVTSGDVEWFERVVRYRLRRLTAERLRQRHGVRMDTDPASARAILGPALHDFLTAPLPRTPTPAEMGRIITRIEEI